jgi:uncharacterized protein (DUF58 family)
MAPRISPALRVHLRGLRLQARRAGGEGLGLHTSRSRGAGLEFAEYRAYEPGDELRRIDWKLYARSDRYFVRDAERDSPLIAWVILDASASMRQGDAARPAWTRLEAAKTFAACVIELALRQGDRYGLLALGGAAPLFIPAAAGTRQRDRCLLELERLAPGEGALVIDAPDVLWERIPPQALVVLLSDFYDEAIENLALRLASARREVVTLQLLTAEERDFPFAGGYRFVDPESGAERLTDAVAVRREFLERFAAARQTLAQRFIAAGIRHGEYVLDRPLEEPLQRLFGARGKGAR